MHFTKRLVLFFTLCLPFLMLNLQAENISRVQAAQIALDFYQEASVKSGISTRNIQPLDFLGDSRLLSAPNAKTVFSSADDAGTAPTFYIFGHSTGNGFVLVAGDDAVRPILGYSFDRKAFPAGNMPENMKAYLQSLHDEISHIRQLQTASAPVRSTSTRRGEAVGNVVVQLETAEWAQRDPYNSQCPQAEGSHCATGCIPTAFSIIMHYHQWPDCGSGILPAYISGNRGFEIAECDLGQHHYQWDKMLKSYNGKYTAEEADAVALLMADVGHCFEVGYGLGSTGGYHNTNSFRKFLKHFKYDAAGERLDREVLANDAEWLRRIKADLDASHPIAYSATSAINQNQPDGRHIFVCDGYTDQDYFHFNWGWGGNGNGYFALSAMNPDDNYNFIVHHIAYLNIMPDEALKPEVTFTVNVKATEGGSARVDGRPTTTVKEGETVRLSARAQYDYRFTHWSVNGEKVSENANYEPVITADTDFLAHFILKETGMDQTAEDALHIGTTPSGSLHIAHYHGTACIYNAKGQLVQSLSVNGETDVQLPHGIYLITAGQEQTKICIP